MIQWCVQQIDGPVQSFIKIALKLRDWLTDMAISTQLVALIKNVYSLMGLWGLLQCVAHFVTKLWYPLQGKWKGPWQLQYFNFGIIWSDFFQKFHWNTLVCCTFWMRSTYNIVVTKKPNAILVWFVLAGGHISYRYVPVGQRKFRNPILFKNINKQVDKKFLDFLTP